MTVVMIAGPTRIRVATSVTQHLVTIIARRQHPVVNLNAIPQMIKEASIALLLAPWLAMIAGRRLEDTIASRRMETIIAIPLLLKEAIIARLQVRRAGIYARLRTAAMCVPTLNIFARKRSMGMIVQRRLKDMIVLRFMTALRLMHHPYDPSSWIR
jgi:hypothetical protein